MIEEVKEADDNEGEAAAVAKEESVTFSVFVPKITRLKVLQTTPFTRFKALQAGLGP